MYGHSQPLKNIMERKKKNRMTFQFTPLLIGLKITSSIGTGVGRFISSSIIYIIFSLEVADTLDSIAKALTDL
jgi:hypothetical protein